MARPFGSPDALPDGDPKTVKPSFMPAVLTWAVFMAFSSALGAIMVLSVPENNRDIIVYMIGQLSGWATSAIAFWLGSTRQSEVKTGLLARAEPVKVDE